MGESEIPTTGEYMAQLTGAPPGTLTADPNALESTIHVTAYNETDFEECVLENAESLQGFLERWSVVWVRVEGLGCIETIKTLGQFFQLHQLALEDVLHTRQRPKIEEYDAQLFFVARMLNAGDSFKTQQLSMFLGRNFVLTFQEGPAPSLDVVRDRLKKKRGGVRGMGADYLAYCILDAVVDFFYTGMDAYVEQVDALEEQVLRSPSDETLAAIHRLKSGTLSVRRAIAPLREAVNTLIRDGHPDITETTRTHFRDCYDHIVHILEMLEIYRETLSGLLDIHLSSVNNRMSEVMRILTVIASVFIPLTFLAGIYGMNFDHEMSPWNMPELHWYWGYPALLLVMLAVAGAELIFFMRKGWIGRPRRADTENANPLQDSSADD